MELLGGIGIGSVATYLLVYLLTVRPLVNDLRRLRYDGFRPETPMPPRPKTVPLEGEGFSERDFPGVS